MPWAEAKSDMSNRKFLFVPIFFENDDDKNNEREREREREKKTRCKSIEINVER